MEVTIQIPNTLEQQVKRMQDRLPEALERGLQMILEEEPRPTAQDEQTILEILTSQPTPEQVLAISPSPILQARFSELLQRSKQGALSREEERELDRYSMLEHLVRLAKTHAYKQRANPS
jgi:hypothetical protein